MYPLNQARSTDSRDGRIAAGPRHRPTRQRLILGRGGQREKLYREAGSDGILSRSDDDMRYRNGTDVEPQRIAVTSTRGNHDGRAEPDAGDNPTWRHGQN